jgi:signal transduction histidine kinase/ActR/RegA family two-component response regulator
MPPHRLDELRAEQIAGFYRNSTPGTVGGMVAAPILTAMLLYENAVRLRVAAIFVLLLAVSTVARLVLIRTYLKVKSPVEDWRHWASWAIATALVGGSCWGLGALFLMDAAPPEYQFMVLLTCAALAAGAITAFGTYLPSYYCNLFTIMVPGCIWSALRGDALHWTYSVLCVLWMVVVAILANSFSKLLNESLALQFANLDLANDLLRQKELAEAANVAKSNFLASASHDLRQPVHALSMFVGALRDRPLDEPSGRLVRQIQNSVGALDSLFGAILDISRLDAGVIEPRPRAFAIQPLLERICRDEMPEVDRKGIALRLVPCGLTVQTDPVLLERVLRNLISNAVRYTDKGRVVVGCRRGVRLSIEVWDSGRGIPADQQDLIFQEFYQIGNPERDRARGLGLGLAIVQRLTRILHIPMQMHSRVDRGSVFKLSVEVAASAPPAIEPPAETSQAAQPPLFILVVDDEVAIQEAMHTLLTGWGHKVITAGSCAEMLGHAAGFTSTPNLIISDYRLRCDEEGIATIERLRSEFNSDIPAILITGDTAPDRIRQATASDCFLLHKPVSNSRLRAAIVNLAIAAPGLL